MQKQGVCGFWCVNDLQWGVCVRAKVNLLRFSLLIYFFSWTPALLASSSTAPAPTTSAFSHEQRDPADPWEKINRRVFAFNEWVDRYFVKPVATGYRWVTPDSVDRMISNFFANATEPLVIVNDVLQGKGAQGAEDFARFTFNSTFGLAGLFDVATTLGLPKHEEDFGQTLAVWGVPAGPYLVLPFLGPRTVRHASASIPDQSLTLYNYAHKIKVRRSYNLLYVIDFRADLFAVESVVSGDRYRFLKDAYLQSQEFKIKDGVVEDDPFLKDM